jgi:DNA-binding transcriptional LysR family regulator
MVQAGVGIGVVPDGAFRILSAGTDLRSVALLDEWASRELRIVVRSLASLSRSAGLLLDHLRRAGDDDCTDCDAKE